MRWYWVRWGHLEKTYLFCQIPNSPNGANSPRDSGRGIGHPVGLHEIDQLRSCFAQVIARRRIRQGWSQADLAGYCGLERSYVSRLEKGIRTPSLDVIFRFAEAFGISPQTLVKEVKVALERPEA